MKIYGDIAVFRNLPKIQHVGFSTPNIYGDISTLANCSELLAIYLRWSKCYGDISSLRNLTKLKNFGIDNCTQITGDISILANLPDLVQAALTNSGITGSINSFANNTKITWLIVNNLTNLEWLELNYGNAPFNSNLTGDIKHLAGLINITTINIGASNVYGNIDNLKNLPKVKLLSFNSCPNISGDINSFRNNTTLQGLALRNSTCYGDISVFSTTPEFHSLFADSTQITGDISVFTNNTKLQLLSVNNLTDLRIPGLAWLT